VLARALGFEGDLAFAAQERALWDLADGLLPHEDVDVYTQGLMDLGATVCLRRAPACPRCPLRGSCAAARDGATERLPVKTRRVARGRRENALLLLSHRNCWWLVRRPEQGVWAGLWSLPEFASVPALASACQAWPGRGQWLPTSTHALTHFDWSLHWLAWRWPARREPPSELTGCAQGGWFSAQQALALGLPAPVRAVLAGLS
jgi:A/G-specific adenine glycosylase